MRRAMQIILPLVVLALGSLVAYYLYHSAAPPKKREKAKPITFVEVQEAVRSDYQIKVTSQGVVFPQISTMIIPEVSGKVISTSVNFLEGRFFKKDDILVEIDSRNFEIALTKSETALIKAGLEYEQEKIRTTNFEVTIVNAKNMLQQNLLALKEEQARSEQALADWQKLGRQGTPGDLVLRKPQLAAAETAVASARADLEKAERDLTLVDTLLKNSQAVIKGAEADVKQKRIDLERCTVKAPFNGRIVKKSVNTGQYVNTGTAIAEVYGIEIAEVRLPLSSKDLTYLKLPGESPQADSVKPVVLFSTEIGGETQTWKGVIDRTESEIDEKSRQNFVIGQVVNPFSTGHSFKPGLFVKASILGNIVKEVLVVPVAAVRESKFVWIVNDKEELDKRDVNIVWRNDKEVVITGEINNGEKICITTLTYAIPHLKVSIKGRKAKTDN